jgi:RecB family endonuclease NucS
VSAGSHSLLRVPAHENLIRDKLSTRLDLIEPDLSLISVDYALPNSVGTRGFIDILARDRHGVLVVIELKRSDTAREALHEVMKYTEILQRERGIENSNIRAVNNFNSLERTPRSVLSLQTWLG